MADSLARGFAGATGLGGAGGGARIPVTGLGGGGGAGRAAAAGGLVAAGGGGLGGAGAAGLAATGGAVGTGWAAGAAGLAIGLGAGGGAFGPGIACGAEVAVSGVPQRAQNLNVAAFNVMHFGHCFGGAPAASRGAGVGEIGF